MNISSESLLVVLLVGAIAGWLAGQIMRSTSFGLIGDLIIGIIGAKGARCCPNSASILAPGLSAQWSIPRSAQCCCCLS